MEDRCKSNSSGYELTDPMAQEDVSFMCNCGEEIAVKVQAEEEYVVVCPKCGQEYRFTGASVLRWRLPSGV